MVLQPQRSSARAQHTQARRSGKSAKDLPFVRAVPFETVPVLHAALRGSYEVINFMSSRNERKSSREHKARTAGTTWSARHSSPACPPPLTKEKRSRD